MKKIFASCLLLFACIPVSFAEKTLTVGDTLTMYFTEIFPHLTKEINDVMVKYNGIGTRSALRSALQRAVYYGMLPNLTFDLAPDKPMSDRTFSEMLQKHF